MSGYKIPEWAYEATGYALENHIISVADLGGFMTASGQATMQPAKMWLSFLGAHLVQTILLKTIRR